MSPVPPPRSLTVKFQGRARVLVCALQVAAAFDPTKTDPSKVKHVQVNAIWDTGATNSVISPKVAKELGLQPTGRKEVNTAGGTHEQNTHVVNMSLPSGVGFPFLSVTEAGLSHGCDALIGMDIISMGDFSVTCANGETIFSFRVPSTKDIDYVQETHIDQGMSRQERRVLARQQQKQQKKQLKK